VTFGRAKAQTNHGRIRTDGISNKQTITITGTTPSVAIGNIFQTNNSSATTITNFTGVVDSQSITIICGDGNTTIANNSNILILASKHHLRRERNLPVRIQRRVGEVAANY
jgi:hypothetical protein